MTNLILSGIVHHIFISIFTFYVMSCPQYKCFLLEGNKREYTQHKFWCGPNIISYANPMSSKEEYSILQQSSFSSSIFKWKTITVMNQFMSLKHLSITVLCYKINSIHLMTRMTSLNPHPLQILIPMF